MSVLDTVQELMQTHVSPYYKTLELQINQHLSHFNAFQIVLLTFAFVYLLNLVRNMMRFFADNGVKGPVVRTVMKVLKNIPGVSGKIRAENDKMVKKMQKMFESKEDQGEKHFTLPQKPMPKKELLSMLAEWSKREKKHWEHGKISGAVYHGGDDLQPVIAEAYSYFMLDNPLHPEIFPYVRKMEAEVVKMSASLFHGSTDACGTMTSGGTESILMAMLSYRQMARERGIQHPEIIAPISAHAAFNKGAYYFGIKLVSAPVDPTTFRVDVKAVRRSINSNTIALVGSAPCYPQGVVDPITELAALARKYRLGLHVDCCLGSFLLPLLRELGYDTPQFDFSIPEVTSISADPHKYGFAPKGCSVVLYKNADIRKYQYFVETNWPGGIYASPSMAGSRAGGLIAACWATMIHLGKDGYLAIAKEIMDTVEKIKAGVQQIPSLRLMGKPDMSVVSFTSDAVDMYKVGEAMTNRGWHLYNLQYPRGLHICVTRVHIPVANLLLQDLRAAVQEVKDNPSKFKDGAAAMYGLAEQIPDRSMVSDLAKTVLDCMYSV